MIGRRGLFGLLAGAIAALGLGSQKAEAWWRPGCSTHIDFDNDRAYTPEHGSVSPIPADLLARHYGRIERGLFDGRQRYFSRRAGYEDDSRWHMYHVDFIA